MGGDAVLTDKAAVQLDLQFFLRLVKRGIDLTEIPVLQQTTPRLGRQCAKHFGIIAIDVGPYPILVLGTPLAAWRDLRSGYDGDFLTDEFADVFHLFERKIAGVEVDIRVAAVVSIGAEDVFDFQAFLVEKQESFDRSHIVALNLGVVEVFGKLVVDSKRGDLLRVRSVVGYLFF